MGYRKLAASVDCLCLPLVWMLKSVFFFEAPDPVFVTTQFLYCSNDTLDGKSAYAIAQTFGDCVDELGPQVI